MEKQSQTKIEPGFTIPVHEHGYVRYLDHMGSDTSIVSAARVSYAGGSKGPVEDRKLLRYLYKNRHTSPFEQGKIQLNIKMPIFIARQYVRHQIFTGESINLTHVNTRRTKNFENCWNILIQDNQQPSLIRGRFND